MTNFVVNALHAATSSSLTNFIVKLTAVVVNGALGHVPGQILKSQSLSDPTPNP